MKHIDLRKQAMKRYVDLWNRQMGDEILVSFARPAFTVRPYDFTYGEVSDKNPPLYDDMPGFMKNVLEGVRKEPHPWDEINDDAVDVPSFIGDMIFGAGMVGAMFDAPVIPYSSARHTMTYNSYIVSCPEDVNRLVCNPQNPFIQKVLAGLHYCVDHATESMPVMILPAFEGGDFLCILCGETQALLDIADDAPHVERLYQLGFESACLLHSMRRDIVAEHNIRAFGNAEYARLVWPGLVPPMDTDTDVMCSPSIFEKYGMRYKQKMLDKYYAGTLYLHTRGLHLVPLIGQLNHLTLLRFSDDPNQPKAFDVRGDIRRQTFDIPLDFICSLDELVKGMREHSLPGGASYQVLAPEGTPVAELERILKEARAYRAGTLSGKPKPNCS